MGRMKDVEASLLPHEHNAIQALNQVYERTGDPGTRQLSKALAQRIENIAIQRYLDAQERHARESIHNVAQAPRDEPEGR